MDRDIAAHIGKILANARKTAKRTQEDVAEKLDIDTGSLSRMECGIILPGIPMLNRIANEIDVTMWQLLRNASHASVTIAEEINSLLEQLELPESRFLLEQIKAWGKQMVAMSDKGTSQDRCPFDQHSHWRRSVNGIPICPSSQTGLPALGGTPPTHHATRISRITVYH